MIDYREYAMSYFDNLSVQDDLFCQKISSKMSIAS